MSMKRCLLILFLIAGLTVSGCKIKPQGYPYKIISDLSGKCLSLPLPGGYYEGDPVEQWDCTHYHMGLQGSWLLEYDDQTNTYQVISIHSGKCIEVNLAAGGKNNGDFVQQAKCNGGDHQKWIFTSGAGGTSTIASLHSGKCLQVRSGTTGGMADGDPIEQWDCIGGALAQQWRMNNINAPNPPLDTAKGELCNVCDPGKPECAPAAKCIGLSAGQYVCGQSCSKTTGCPAGYACTPITQLGQTIYQCVPNNNECPRDP